MLEQRNGKSYWYTYKRQGGRGRRVYAGCGVVAEQAAQEAWKRQAQQEQDRQQVRQERQRRAEVDALVNELITQTDQLVQATLEAAGYNRPQRGPWRRKRHAPVHHETPSRSDLREGHPER
jgi:hypothetical protein